MDDLDGFVIASFYLEAMFAIEIADP